MSEVQSRPSAPRGRGSARGGRAGFGSRGGRGGRSHATTSGDKPENTSSPSIDDDGEVGQLKRQYGTKVSTIREMYPDWTDEDVVFALQETGGDLELTVERITDGTITQWGEVSKTKKDRSKSKAKESTHTHGDSGNAPRVVRSGHDSGRGGRGRGNDRGRGGRGRGASVAQTNGAHSKPVAPLSVPTEESNVWNTAVIEDTSDDSKAVAESLGSAAATVPIPAVEIAKTVVASVVPDGKRTWASMFKAEPAPKPKKEPAPVEKVPEKVEPEAPVEPEAAEPTPKIAVAEPVVEAKETVTQPEVVAAVEEVVVVVEESETALAPSNDELTETNLGQVLDTSGPTPSATVASTAASSWDPRNIATNGTPYSALQSQAAAARAAPSGFATSALKATAAVPRTPSHQRRVLDQEEAVRMPGNREVDRTAVQFGAFSLGGAGEEDVDGDREEPETRAQPPQHSPIAQPRASLPPAPAQQPTAAPESLPTPKEPQGLPAAPHPVAAPGLPSPLPGAQSMAQQGSQGAHQYSQYGRYGQPGGQEQSTFGQKPYDPFSQQAPAAQSQYEGYPSQQNQAQTQQQAGAFSSAPSEYSQYYTADQQRHAYQNYYGQQYGQQQAGQAQQDGPATQQRAFSGYNAPPADTASTFPQSSAQQTQSRYATAGEAQTSGHTTPNPPAQSQQTTQSTQAQQAHPSQPQGQPGGQYPYGNPYYSSPYYTAAYMNNYQQGYGQGNYGAGPYGKGGMYNQPHQYGMSPQTPYDHTPTPATGAFSQSALHGRESAVGGGLNEYGRAGTQQSQAAQPLGGSGGFDAFGRGSSYQGQAQQYGQGSQQGAADDLKSFGDSKSANVPAPALTQAARPGSAANVAPGQSTLPPPQSAQQSYGGYPSHLQQQHALHGSQSGSQYGALGGLGGHQAAGQGHQSSQYGGYGQGFTGSYYGNNQQRGGWGNNYQH